VVAGAGVDGALLEHQEDLLWKAMTASLNQEAQVTHIMPNSGNCSTVLIEARLFRQCVMLLLRTPRLPQCNDR
jgi:hypothetical protein